MTTQEFDQILKTCSEEVAVLMTSMKGLLLLAERYPSSQEIQSQLVLISRCLIELENVINEAKRNLCTSH